MLKVFLGFLVSVVGLLSSAYVGETAYASSATVLITNIQAGGVGAATQEFIAIYNNSSEDIDITGWCLKNKNNVAITCFSAPLPGQAIYLPGYTYATAASGSLAALLPVGTVTSTYVPMSQSSGSLIGSSDTVTLVDHTDTLVDRHSWTVAIAGGSHFERIGSGSPILYQDTGLAADWLINVPNSRPVDGTQIDTTIIDVCSDIEGDQIVLPSGKELDSSNECIDKVIFYIDITELLPNAAGSDAGNEFIELYNPNDVDVGLADYKLLVGMSYENEYAFPTGVTIPSHQYLRFMNSEIDFNLQNSSSRIALALHDGTLISEAPKYTNPKDNQSWALIDTVWQYTNQPTPGLANLVSDPTLEDDLLPEPCAANQYRSPETNRCRLIATVATATPCKDNQYRSEETNRCRNITSDIKTIMPCEADEERNIETNRCRKIVAAAVLAACKQGQERNPDTNRCRTVTKMPNADYAVLGAETKNSGNWYVLAAIGGVLLLAVGYAVWEWHVEIKKFFQATLVRVRQFARLHK